MGELEDCSIRSIDPGVYIHHLIKTDNNWVSALLKPSSIGLLAEPDILCSRCELARMNKLRRLAKVHCMYQELLFLDTDAPAHFHECFTILGRRISGKVLVDRHLASWKQDYDSAASVIKSA